MPGQGLHVLDGIDDGPVEAQLVEQRRPKLADERADVAQLAAQQLAQEAELGPGQQRVGLDDPLDVLGLDRPAVPINSRRCAGAARFVEAADTGGNS